MPDQLTFDCNRDAQPALAPALCSPVPLKAIVLWEPWATLMAIEVKKNETRSWPTQHRGPLVICAAKRRTKMEEMGPAAKLLWENAKAIQGYHSNFHDLFEALPFGCAVCVVDVYDCWPTERFKTTGIVQWPELLAGDYSPGRWAWKTRNCRRLKTPVPVIGRQGFFSLPADAESAVREQLANSVLAYTSANKPL